MRLKNQPRTGRKNENWELKSCWSSWLRISSAEHSRLNKWDLLRFQKRDLIHFTLCASFGRQKFAWSLRFDSQWSMTFNYCSAHMLLLCFLCDFIIYLSEFSPLLPQRCVSIRDVSRFLFEDFRVFARAFSLNGVVAVIVWLKHWALPSSTEL